MSRRTLSRDELRYKIDCWQKHGENSVNQEQNQDHAVSNKLPNYALSPPSDCDDRRSVNSSSSIRTQASALSAKVKVKMAELKIKQASERRELTNRLEDLELAHNLEAAKVEEALWDNFAREDPGFITLDEVGADPELNLNCPPDEIAPKVTTCDALYSATTLPKVHKANFDRDFACAPPLESTSVNIKPTFKQNSNEMSTEIANLNRNAAVTTHVSSSSAPHSSNCSNAELSTLIKYLNRPKPEIITFDGNPMNYWRFIRNFECQIDENLDLFVVMLSLLIQHCKGKARKLIEPCVKMNPETGYNQARKLLHDNYGKSHIVAQACVRQAVDGPQLRSDDADGLNSLTQTLRDCLLTLSDLGENSEMNNYPALIGVVKRLSYRLREGWKRKVAKIIDETNREPLFEHLVDFVERESKVVNTTFSKRMDEEIPTHKGKKDVYRVKTSSHVITKTYPGKDNRVKRPLFSGVQSLAKECPCCKRQHILANCNEFKAKSFRDKIRLVRQCRLCDNCFGFNHIAANCNAKRACTVEGCGRAHHLLLHNEKTTDEKSGGERRASSGDSQEQQPQSPVYHASQDGCHINLMMVPVKVSANDRVVDTFALLDTGSGVTLCNEKLLKILGVAGKTSHISLKTINNEVKNRQAKRA